MADDAPTEDLSEETQPTEAQPDGLTAVSEDPSGPADGAGDQPAAENVDGAEPESRLILENTVEPAEYMPLFVAPQPVEADAEPDEDYDDSDDSDDGGPDSDEDQADRPSRRRRRGRRGRGRGRGEQNGDDSGDDSDDGESDGEDSGDDSDDDSADDDTSGGDGATRRRRRRRRRKSGGGADSDGSPDDPPNTVVHERAGRSKRQGQRRDSRHHRIDATGGQAPAPSRRTRCRASPSADPERSRIPGPP